MKLVAPLKQLNNTPENWLRRAGYAIILDRSSGQYSFVRRLSSDHYPRFHLYYDLFKNKEGLDLISFNLHLDQKKPAYVGYKRHNAEYDSPLVEEEMKRLKSFLLDFL